MSALRPVRLTVVVFAAGALLACGGCGQKGALYLPDPAPQAVPQTPAGPETPAAPAAATPQPADAATRGKAPRLPDPAKAQ